MLKKICATLFKITFFKKYNLKLLQRSDSDVVNSKRVSIFIENHKEHIRKFILKIFMDNFVRNFQILDAVVPPERIP